MITDETKTLATIIRHRAQVSFLLRELAREFERRADLHDVSKFQLDELEGFVEVNRIAREHAFGSEEYNNSLKDNQAIALHFSRNPHHPEYHAGGINDMSFIDFIEMVVDWIAANKTYGTTKWEAVITEQKRRFNLVYPQLFLINFIAEWFGMK